LFVYNGHADMCFVRALATIINKFAYGLAHSARSKMMEAVEKFMSSLNGLR